RARAHEGRTHLAAPRRGVPAMRRTTTAVPGARSPGGPLWLFPRIRCSASMAQARAWSSCALAGVGLTWRL
ncbi:MAG: hypothetical protein L0Y64_18150, partial [Myxococcaceae bacterium]|nr:hypothetical protein [Myxococcaceae bacterium]